MTDLGATDTSTTTLSANQFPVSAAWVPNQALTAVEGIAVNTDAGSKKSTAVRMGLKDGDSVTLGSKADAKASATDTTAITIMQVLKQISYQAQNPASTPVTGTFWQATQPISAASLPLPSGASTAAKQPALGTAGTASSDVITVQGIVSMTPLKVDGSGVTQPVSGTFWQATQPVSGTFWQATQPVSGTVTANLGTLNGVALDTSVNGLLIAQGATLGSQTAPMIQGSVSTNSPSYTTGQISPLSLSTSGGLRVSAQISGVAVVGGNGTTTAQVQRVTLSSDSTGQVALAAGAAVIGALTANQSVNVNQIAGTNVNAAAAGTQLVGVADGSGNALTSNSTTYTAKKALDANLLGTLGTAFSTAGKVDVKAAAGDIADLAHGQATMANSVPVTIASNQGAIGSVVIQAVAGTALVADQTNSELRVSNYVKTTTAGDTALTLGQATKANSLPMTLASDQAAIVVGVTAGTAFDSNSGTIGANTLRTAHGGAATGTKSNAASSASSVTILASNTARKGAMLYNDSTQICYVDLSGGTASSSSYSLQMSANAFFELPGPNVYNGAITGIWASANGNMRVTEFS